MDLDTHLALVSIYTVRLRNALPYLAVPDRGGPVSAVGSRQILMIVHGIDLGVLGRTLRVNWAPILPIYTPGQSDCPTPMYFCRCQGYSVTYTC